MPSSIGLSRSRTTTAMVFLTGFARTFEGETKYYRTQTVTTSYAGMVEDAPPPDPDRTYTVSPEVVVYEAPRGWSSQTTLSPSGTVTTDDDGELVVTTTPEEWTPPLIGFPTFSPTPTVSETATTYVETYSAVGSWSGTRTETTEWSDEIPKSELVGAAESAISGAVFGVDDYTIYAGDPPSPLYSFDEALGEVTLVVVDYSLGTYTARPFISFLETLTYSFDSWASSQDQVVGRTSTLTDVITLPPPPAGPFGQDLFRDDDKHIFGEWYRVDPHERFPAADEISTILDILGFSGHKFIMETTGVLLETRGYCFLGLTTAPADEDFLVPIGTYTPP